MNSSVFSDFLKSAKDVEERTASGKLFQTEVAAARETSTANGGSTDPRNDKSTVIDSSCEWCVEMSSSIPGVGYGLVLLIGVVVCLLAAPTLVIKVKLNFLVSRKHWWVTS